MGCQALLEITEVQFVKGISVYGKEQAICHTPQQGGQIILLR